MAFDNNISGAIQQYVYTQSGGLVTEPVNGTYIQAYCEFLGITEPVNNSWLVALCFHFGVTEPLGGAWVIALSNYYGITTPAPYGTWWMALAFATGTPTIPFIWNQNTNNWNDEIRKWESAIAPIADFTSDTTTPNSGQNVQFTDTSTNMPSSWAWTFTGGTPATSTDQDPLVSFETTGGHTVSLQVTNDSGTDTKTVTDYINVNPVVADFTSDETVIFENSSINYTDTSTGAPTDWLWTFPGGTPSTSTLQNPTIAYDTPGTYTVTLEASNAGSTDTEIKTNYITVNVIPIVANFTADNTTPVEGGSVTFTDTSTASPTEWAWTFTGGTPTTSTLQNPVIAYDTAGTYTVSLTASKTGSSDTETKIDYITAVFIPDDVVINSWEVAPFMNNLNGKSTTQFSVGPFSNNLITY